MYHQNDLNTIGCHLIVISLVFFKNSQFRTPRSLSPPWFPKIIYYLFIFLIIFYSFNNNIVNLTKNLPPPLKKPKTNIWGPKIAFSPNSPIQNVQFQLESTSGSVKNKKWRGIWKEIFACPHCT